MTSLQQPAKLFSAHVQTVSPGKARGEARDFGAREGLEVHLPLPSKFLSLVSSCSDTSLSRGSWPCIRRPQDNSRAETSVGSCLAGPADYASCLSVHTVC